MADIYRGSGLETLFALTPCKRRRASSYDTSGGNHDWVDLAPGQCRAIADIDGCGIIRHIWCTMWVHESPHGLRELVLRMYWDGEDTPSVEAPLGDFFGMGHALSRNFTSAPLSMSPEDGRAMNCFFPMPFERGARLTIENQSASPANFYYYIDYERWAELPEDAGRFHAQWRRERHTDGWLPAEPGILDREKLGDPAQPAWYPRAWAALNPRGEGNYTILEATGRGKYVGCNLNIDVFERQGNDWYGEGDDMIFIDGDETPTLHGTGTEDYFNTAFCPKTPFHTPTHGITLYSGDAAGFPWGGKNSMYRFHIQDPIQFDESIRVTIEHGHANKLSNDYSSTAYWYQSEPHAAFPALPGVRDRLPREDAAREP